MMDLYTVSEEAYKNGYAAGLVDGKKEAMKCISMELLKDVLDAVAGCSGRHGRWIDKGEYAVCMECGGRSSTQYNGVEPIPLMTQFCPHCGAKMDADEK